MGVVRKLKVIKDERSDGTIKIYPLAYLVVVDEEQRYFKESMYIEVDLEVDTIDSVIEKIKKAEDWVSVSRRRLERAKEIAEKLDIPLEVEEDC
ncbi:MAG: hypothetical protein QXH85_05665 [Candidatus Bathyarchaeia archaeon]